MLREFVMTYWNMFKFAGEFFCQVLWSNLRKQFISFQKEHVHQHGWMQYSLFWGLLFYSILHITDVLSIRPVSER